MLDDSSVSSGNGVKRQGQSKVAKLRLTRARVGTLQEAAWRASSREERARMKNARTFQGGRGS